MTEEKLERKINSLAQGAHYSSRVNDLIERLFQFLKGFKGFKGSSAAAVEVLDTVSDVFDFDVADVFD